MIHTRTCMRQSLISWILTYCRSYDTRYNTNKNTFWFLERFKNILIVNGEIQLIWVGRRIMNNFLKNVACVIGVKYSSELILTDYIAVSFINKNSTHATECILKMLLLHKTLFPWNYQPKVTISSLCATYVAKYVSILKKFFEGWDCGLPVFVLNPECRTGLHIIKT